MSEVIPCLISKDDGKGNFVKAENARIEKVDQDCANTLTCHEASFNVHHCNMVIVQGNGDICPTLMAGNSEIVKIEKVGQISNESSQCGTVVSTEGLYPTISAGCHGYANPHILEKNGFYEQAIKTAKENNAQEGDIVDAFNQRVLTDGISPTITTRPEGKKTAILPVVERYRIRKLTPRECFRLMNVEEEQFNRAAFEKNVFYLEGEEDKCNAKLKVVQEKFRHIDLETYVLCTTNSILNMEELEIIKQKCKIKKQDEKTQNVNIVIEQLAKSGLMECVTNTTKCTEFMGMRYLLIEKQNLHPHMDIIVQVKKDKENTEKYMKITTESNLPASKLYTILILLGQIIQSKIFGSTILKANIQGNIVITEVYENSILLKVSNLKMENISTRVSSSQLYKVAGNAIVVSVLCALFSQLGIQGKKKWNDMTEDERITLVHKNTVMEGK